MEKITDDSWPKIASLLELDGYKNVVLYVEHLHDILVSRNRLVSELKKEKEDLAFLLKTMTGKNNKHL